MATCYYTCNLVPLGLPSRFGFNVKWLGSLSAGPSVAARKDALSVHPMTCPFVTRLVAAADEIFSSAERGLAERADAADGADAAAGSDASRAAVAQDCLIVPGGCDAMRRAGDLLAASYPGRVFVLPMPRSAKEGSVRTLARDLATLCGWLADRAEKERPDATPAGASVAAPAAPQAPPVDYPSMPRPGGAFVVAGPLSDDGLLWMIEGLGVGIAGLESCTSPERWRLLLGLGARGAGGGAQPGREPATGELRAQESPGDLMELARDLLAAGICPRRSTVERRDHLRRRLEESEPSSIIYARQSFCDPGAYDALLVTQLAQESELPFLEIEVGFPFEASGPLRTRIEAFLEAQLLSDDLLDDLEEDFTGDDLFDGMNGMNGEDEEI